MKKLILGLILLASMSSYANTVDSNIFVAEGKSGSKTPFMAGCSSAKEEAIANAKMACHEAGYSICEEVETKRMFRRGAKASIIFFGLTSYNDEGVCGYKSIYEGIEETEQI